MVNEDEGRRARRPVIYFGQVDHIDSGVQWAIGAASAETSVEVAEHALKARGHSTQ